MSKEEDFKLLKIKTIIMKVNIHCDGCKHEVKKLLQRTEGVYTVSVDAEQQKVTVSGNVHPANLIKRLAKAGKHAEVHHPKSNNNNNNSANITSQALVLQGLKAFKNRHDFKPNQPSIKDVNCNSTDSGEKNANIKNKNKNKNKNRPSVNSPPGDLRGAMLAKLRGLKDINQQDTMRMQHQVPQYATGYYCYPYADYCQWGAPDVSTHHCDYGEGGGYDDEGISTTCSVM